MKASPRPPVFMHLAVLGIVLVVCLLMLEVGARIHEALQSPPEDVVPAEVGRFDPSLGWSLRRKISAVSRRTENPVEYRTNSNGLRDDESPLAKPPGTYRIVLLGDSRTFGYGVPIEQHFSKLLEGYQEHIEVLNLGVSGYGVDQELLYLRQSGFKYEPDLVLAYVAHYGDHRHMHNMRFGKAKPQFHLTSQGLQLQPLQADSGGSEPGQQIAFLKLSALYRMLDLAWDRLTGRERPESYSYLLDRKADLRDAQDAGFVQRMNDLGFAIVAEMNRACQSRSVEFVLVSQIPDLLDRAIASGIRTIDVRGVLSNPHYSLPDGLAHINEAGNGALAWELYQRLTIIGLLPDQAAPEREP